MSSGMSMSMSNVNEDRSKVDDPLTHSENHLILGAVELGRCGFWDVLGLTDGGHRDDGGSVVTNVAPVRIGVNAEKEHLSVIMSIYRTVLHF